MPLFQPSFQHKELDRKKSRLFGTPDDVSNMEDQVSPQDALPPMLQQNNAQSPQPDQPNDSPSLKQRLFGYSDPVKNDEYGLEKPTKSHEGILSKIATYALPTLVGLAGGVGVLPGLATAYAGVKGAEGRQQNLEQELYNKDRATALQEKRLNMGQSMQDKRLAQELGLKGAELGLQREKLAWEKQKESPATKKQQQAEEKKGQLLSSIDEMEGTLGQIPSGGAGLLSQAASKAHLSAHNDAIAGFDSLKTVLAGEYAKDALGRVNQTEYNYFMKNVTPSIYDTPGQRKEKFNKMRGLISGKFSNEPSSRSKPTNGVPQGATGKVPGPDGKFHYHDSEGNDLGVVQ